MSAFNNAVLTTQGSQVLAKAMEPGESLVFTRMALGDGRMAQEFDEREMKDKTALGQERLSLRITDQVAFPEENAMVFMAKVDNSRLDEGFKARELGLYAANKSGGGKLYAYAYAGDKASFVPDKSKPAGDSVVRIAVTTGGAENVSFDLDFSTVMSETQLQTVRQQIAQAVSDGIRNATDAIAPRLDAIETSAAALASRMDAVENRGDYNIAVATDNDLAGIFNTVGY